LYVATLLMIVRGRAMHARIDMSITKPHFCNAPFVSAVVLKINWMLKINRPIILKINRPTMLKIDRRTMVKGSGHRKGNVWPCSTSRRNER
jgi:hypothetical protein